MRHWKTLNAPSTWEILTAPYISTATPLRTTQPFEEGGLKGLLEGGCEGSIVSPSRENQVPAVPPNVSHMSHSHAHSQMDSFLPQFCAPSLACVILLPLSLQGEDCEHLGRILFSFLFSWSLSHLLFSWSVDVLRFPRREMPSGCPS